MKPGTNFIRRNGSTLYPWSALHRGEFFIVPGKLDRWGTLNLFASAHYQKLRIRLRRFRHSVRVESIGRMG